MRLTEVVSQIEHASHCYSLAQRLLNLGLVCGVDSSHGISLITVVFLDMFLMAKEPLSIN